ncbi:arginase [Fulvitalea axinellae]|uniref:Arginase n=1 Tax=Fulvitalea axinellae TaxID=1182444 RepID=A0AAU9CMI6_9BACT|nr:arginase [Fulvitalea axinellae]
MDLKLFFSPVDHDVCRGIDSPSDFYRNIDHYHDTFPEIGTFDIAIIGGVKNHADLVRTRLYRLKKSGRPYRIVDLGNLRYGVDHSQRLLILQEVCVYLLRNNVLPLVIGGSHDMSLGQFRAYSDLRKLVTVVNVDAFIDLDTEEEVPANRGFIGKMFADVSGSLFHYSHLAYQAYLNDTEVISALQGFAFDMIRLGVMREDLGEVEPVIRDADMMTFDLSSIRASDAPGTTNPQAFGLTGEEACKLCWYAGLNDKLSSVGFYEFDSDRDGDYHQTAQVVATMVWYFVEGFYHRKREANFQESDYTKYSVTMPVSPSVLVFYKSHYSDKWWMEIPSGSDERGKIVPCAYSDYKTATEGEVPERLLNVSVRFS